MTSCSCQCHIDRLLVLEAWIASFSHTHALHVNKVYTPPPHRFGDNLLGIRKLLHISPPPPTVLGVLKAEASQVVESSQVFSPSLTPTPPRDLPPSSPVQTHYVTTSYPLLHVRATDKIIPYALKPSRPNKYVHSDLATP